MKREEGRAIRSVSWNRVCEIVNKLAQDIMTYEASHRYAFNGIYGIPKSGKIPAAMLEYKLKKAPYDKPSLDTLIVDNITDTGKTMLDFPRNPHATLFATPWSKAMPFFVGEITEDWVVFPWEVDLKESLEKSQLKPRRQQET